LNSRELKNQLRPFLTPMRFGGLPLHSLELKNAQIRDLPVILKLEKEGFLPGIQEKEDVFIQRLKFFPQGFFLVYERNMILGYINFEIWERKASWETYPFQLNHHIAGVLNIHGPILYLASMTISPLVRGKKVGTWLLRRGVERMIQDFPQLEEVILVVNEQWKGAQKIYLSMGFRVLGKIEGFFTAEAMNTSAALVMRKPLNLPQWV